MDYVEGEILYFDKPLRWTSFDLVGKVRYLLCRQLGIKKLKVGHAGTLDPLATGVMVVCTGKKTRMIDQLQLGVKHYVATLQLGATTPSFDLETAVDATYPTEHITENRVREVLQHFVGEIWQTPPVYSAVKIDGKRAYDYARRGEQVELKPKLLVIDQIELLDFSPLTMRLTIRVVCSKGTYIRALARDIGEALQSGAHLIALRRTQVGEVNESQCWSIEQFEQQIKAAMPNNNEAERRETDSTVSSASSR